LSLEAGLAAEVADRDHWLSLQSSSVGTRPRARVRAWGRVARGPVGLGPDCRRRCCQEGRVGKRAARNLREGRRKAKPKVGLIFLNYAASLANNLEEDFDRFEEEAEVISHKLIVRAINNHKIIPFRFMGR
jgi:hypothetical protein